MRKKRNDFDAVGAERMTDTELSKKLGSYQRMESIGILLGVILVITGCIMMFVYRNIIVICILAFSGVALFLLVAQPAQKKKKALMKQQLGGFFRTELTKAFGPEPEPVTLPIDWAYLKAAKLSTVSFTECTVTDFHEGEHKGLRFSAANVELRRTVEEKSGPDNDNWMTRTETLFRGIVVRCKDICDPTLDIALNDTFQERKKDDITDPAAFRKHFAAHTADGREADDQVTPQLRDLVQKLEASSSRFGIRSIEFIADKGFYLNGEHRKFQGVCNHHDLGVTHGTMEHFVLCTWRRASRSIEPVTAFRSHVRLSCIS